MVAALVFASCNTDSKKNEHEGHDMSNVKDTTEHVSTEVSKIKTVTVKYTDVDFKAAKTIKELVDHYLLVKNSLANDNASDAAAGAKSMVDDLSKMDKSLLTADQKKSFDVVEEGLKEHASHIAKKSDDIKHQRGHFVELSMNMYELVKTFGAGRVIYQDFCPMAKDNKGALWISETKEIKNPYFGATMPECGSVEEEIR